MTKEKVSRTHVYIQHPTAYEIAGCPQQSIAPTAPPHEIEWSEFEHHLWCSRCKKDFIPLHNGIFDGPIPANLALMMGISFDRINIETKEVIKFKPDFTKEEWLNYNRTWADFDEQKFLEQWGISH